jgi:hypothetical protein
MLPRFIVLFLGCLENSQCMREGARPCERGAVGAAKNERKKVLQASASSNCLECKQVFQSFVPADGIMLPIGGAETSVRRRFLGSSRSKPLACLHLLTWDVGPEAQ